MKYLIASCLLLLVFVDCSCCKEWELVPGSNKDHSRNARILFGANAGENDHPYMVQIVRSNKLACGGTLIGPSCVLTAAHCLLNATNDQLEVRAGSVHLKRSKGAQVSKVATVAIPPEFVWSGQVLDMDVAILRLQSPLQGEKIKPIELDLTNDVESGDVIQLLGWGMTYHSEFHGPLPYHLQEANQTVISQKKCKRAFKGSTNYNFFQLTKEQFCAKGSPDEAASIGDSGGPALRNGKQVGIVSFGDYDVLKASREVPNVYTSLASPKIAKWVNEKRQQFCENSTSSSEESSEEKIVTRKLAVPLF